MSVCHIVGAGECPSLNTIKLNDGDTVIAADNGLTYLNAVGIKPNHIIGDFDSLGSIPEGDNVTVLPAEKDVTDMYSAAEFGMKAGFTDFRFYGWSGGRFDHTLANVQLCAHLAQSSCKAEFITDRQIMTAVCCSELHFDSSHKGYISVLSFTDKSVGVTLKGLKYPLDNAVLTNAFPLGTSNEFTGTDSTVKVENGTLIVIFDA